MIIVKYFLIFIVMYAIIWIIEILLEVNIWITIFKLDTSKAGQKDFLKKTEFPLGIAFLLTGIETVAAILFFIKGISGAVWNEMGVYEFAVKSLHFASIVSYFPVPNKVDSRWKTILTFFFNLHSHYCGFIFP